MNNLQWLSKYKDIVRYNKIKQGLIMLELGKEIGLPSELISDSKVLEGKVIRCIVEGYDATFEEYELSYGAGHIFLPKGIVESNYKSRKE